jgi:hypothetical protein
MLIIYYVRDFLGELYILTNDDASFWIYISIYYNNGEIIIYPCYTFLSLYKKLNEKWKIYKYVCVEGVMIDKGSLV